MGETVKRFPYRFDDRMAIDFDGVNDTPCVVEAHGLGRNLAACYVALSRGRIIIHCEHEPTGLHQEGEIIDIPEGAEIQLLTPYAKPGYVFPAIPFAPGIRVSVTAVPAPNKGGRPKKTGLRRLYPF